MTTPGSLRNLLLGAIVLLGFDLTSAEADEMLLSTKQNSRLVVQPGGTIVTIKKRRALPNIFGQADIFGRKVQSGVILFIYHGVDSTGRLRLRRVDIDIHSTASTMSRSGGFAFGNSWGNSQVWGSFNRHGGQIQGYGSSGAQAFAFRPNRESTTVLPPRAADFLFPADKVLELPTGHTLRFLDVQSYQIAFVVESRRKLGRRRSNQNRVGKGPFAVTNVQSGDLLNLRSAPLSNGAQPQILAKLPPTARALIGTGRSKTVGRQRWIEIKYRGQIGWVNGYYLRTDRPAK